jgi:PST family polysaccharide transporter
MTAVTGGKVARGAAWMLVARLTDRAIGLASTVILARLLSPADFGLVAMAMAVIALIEVASAFGFEVPLIREAKPARTHYDTVWTLNLLFGCGCGAAIALAAWPAAAFYADARIVPIMLVLAAAWAVGGLANVGVVDFRRELNFAKEFRFLMFTRISSFAVTIPSAFIFQSYWALIAGMATGRVVNVVLSYLWHPFRPRICLKASRELFSFSVWLFVEKLAAFGNARLGDFLLGRTHGPTELGVYRLGEEIGYLPGSELVAPINRAFLPGASRLVESGRSMAQVLLSTNGIVALFSLPACLGIAAVADPLVRAMLGERWLAAVPIVQIMAVNAVFVSLWSTQQTALLAAGFPEAPGRVALARFAVFFPCALLLTPLSGAEGLALAVLVSSTWALGLGLTMTSRRISFGFGPYFLSMWRPLTAATLMFFVVSWVTDGMTPSPSSLLSLMHLAVAIAVGAFSYALLLALLYFISGRPQGAEQRLFEELRAWLRR